MSLKLQALRYFVTVAEDLHYGRAAARLRMTQPPLTKQIQRLEAELGLELLSRNHRRVELTDAGQVLLGEGRSLLRAAEQFERLMADMRRGTRGHLSVGFVPRAAHGLLPCVLREFRTRFPLVELSFHERGQSSELASGLRAHSIDVAIMRLDVALMTPISWAAILDDSFEMASLLTEGYVIALPCGHPLAEASAPHIKDAAGEDFAFISPALQPNTHQHLLGYCDKAGFAPRVVYEASDTTALLAFVAAGYAVALVPESVTMTQPPGLVYRPLRPATPTIELVLASRRSDRSSATAHFREAALAVARDRSAGADPRPRAATRS